MKTHRQFMFSEHPADVRSDKELSLYAMDNEKWYYRNFAGDIKELGGGGVGSDVVNFGSAHQIVPLPFVGGFNTDGSFFSFTQDSAYPGGGYAGCNNSSAYFSALVNLGPKGSIWGLRIRASGGPDYSKCTISLASLLYASSLRPSGDPTGKIQGVDEAYGTISYIDLVTQDFYNTTFIENFGVGGAFVFIIGGNIGDPLTDFNGLGTDPMTGYQIADGGPGWYRLKFRVNGRNIANTTGNKLRFSAIDMFRLDDAGNF